MDDIDADERPRIPRFGIPDRIEPREAAFVFVAGVPLALVLIGILSALVTDLDTPTGGPLMGALFIGTLGLGPATAFYLHRRLVASHTPIVIGCAGLVAWTLALVAAGLSGGWLGVAAIVSWGVAGYVFLGNRAHSVG